jgi:hypothetical protein
MKTSVATVDCPAEKHCSVHHGTGAYRLVTGGTGGGSYRTVRCKSLLWQRSPAVSDPTARRTGLSSDPTGLSGV